MEALLSAEGISKTIGKQKILDKIDLDLYEGDFTVIMGPSGAGKSTLLYALSGMDKITEGSVFYRGQDLGSLKEKQMAHLRAAEFGFIFQGMHLVSNLTLYENVFVAGCLQMKKGKELKSRVLDLLKEMHVGDAMNRLPCYVSGGEAQRAAIARAVINRPGIVFADEPTGALNRKNTTEVMDLLVRLNQSGQSMVMVTHDTRTALYGDRLIYMEDGKLVDELKLPKFEEALAKERESTITQWLSSMHW